MTTIVSHCINQGWHRIALHRNTNTNTNTNTNNDDKY